MTSKNRYRLLRAADHRRMPWKNGLGVTMEIAVEPTGASLDQFDWRLSMARIDADGAFSSFPGQDRLLMMLEGRVELSINARDRIELSPYQCAEFPGEAAVSSRLLSDEPVLDLNVMVHRERYVACLWPLTVQGQTSLACTAAITALVCRTPDVSVTIGQDIELLQINDVLLVTAGIVRLELHHAAATVAVIKLDRV